LAEAARWYRLASEQGLALAQYNLGILYGDGEGVPKDAVEAHAWWNVAAARGHELAKENLAVIEEEMTPEQIADATKLARERFEKFAPKN
jgi:TPR repeat protein